MEHDHTFIDLYNISTDDLELDTETTSFGLPAWNEFAVSNTEPIPLDFPVWNGFTDFNTEHFDSCFTLDPQFLDLGPIDLNDHQGVSNPEAATMAGENLSHTVFSAQTVSLDGTSGPSSPAMETEDVPPTQSRSKPTAAARKILETFFKMELYPDKKETEIIAIKAQMSMKQVRQWFRNKRKRTTDEELARMHEDESKNSIPLTSASLEDLRRLSSTTLGEEPSEEDDGINRPRLTGQEYLRLYVSNSERREKAPRMSIGYSPSSRGSSGGRSNVSNASRISKNSASRKGRRIWQQPVAPKTIGTKPYTCTFCWQGFKNRYSWKRHEETVHFRKDRWVCNVRGPEIDPRYPLLCPYCDLVLAEPALTQEHMWQHVFTHDFRKAPVPSCPYCQNTPMSKIESPRELDELRSKLQTHLETHKHELCTQRPVSDRTFYRKEHMKQHLLNYHGAEQSNVTHWLLRSLKACELAEAPSTPLDPYLELHCPFCVTKFEDWPSRVQHVGDHFQNGDRLPIPRPRKLQRNDEQGYSQSDFPCPVEVIRVRQLELVAIKQ